MEQQTANVTGKWDVTIRMPDKNVTEQWTITQDKSGNVAATIKTAGGATVTETTEELAEAGPIWKLVRCTESGGRCTESKRL